MCAPIYLDLTLLPEVGSASFSLGSVLGATCLCPVLQGRLLVSRTGRTSCIENFLRSCVHQRPNRLLGCASSKAARWYL